MLTGDNQSGTNLANAKTGEVIFTPSQRFEDIVNSI